MPKDNLSPREAGSLITSQGLADDVITARDEQITQRRGRQREEADDADHRTPKPKRGKGRRDDAEDTPRRRASKTRHEVEEDADEGDFEDEVDEDADSSTREDGELEDGDEVDEEDAEDSDEEDADGSEDADEDGDDTEDEDLYTVKINGKEEKVTLQELRAGYQRNRDYIQKTQAIAGKHRELQGGHSKVAEQYARKLQHLGALYGGIKHILVGDIDSQEMQQLLVTDPQKWQIQRTLMQDRIGKVDQVLNGLNAEHERHVGEYSQTQKANLQTVIDAERALVSKHIPDWDTTGKVRLGKYLNGKGFTNEELVAVVDHRMLLIAEDARKWQAYQASKGKPMKRKVKPAPKSIKTGQGQLRRGGTAKRQEETAFRKDIDRARKTGDMRDAGRAIRHLIK